MVWYRRFSGLQLPKYFLTSSFTPFKRSGNYHHRHSYHHHHLYHPRHRPHHSLLSSLLSSSKRCTVSQFCCNWIDIQRAFPDNHWCCTDIFCIWWNRYLFLNQQKKANVYRPNKNHIEKEMTIFLTIIIFKDRYAFEFFLRGHFICAIINNDSLCQKKHNSWQLIMRFFSFHCIVISEFQYLPTTPSDINELLSIKLKVLAKS